MKRIIFSLLVIFNVQNSFAFDKKLINFLVEQEALQEYQRVNQMPLSEAADQALHFIKSLLDQCIIEHCYKKRPQDAEVLVYKRYLSMVALYAIFIDKQAGAVPFMYPHLLHYMATGELKALNVNEINGAKLLHQQCEDIFFVKEAIEKLSKKIGVEQELLFDWDAWPAQDQNQLEE